MRLQARILAVWFTANIAIAGLASLLAGEWYLGWPLPSWAVALVELALLMLPNLLLPILTLRFWQPGPVRSIRQSLGWVWNGWRSILAGAATYAAALFITRGVTDLWGSGIPYSLPGAGGGVIIPPGQPWLLLALLVWLVLFVMITVAGEETMFRGWIQDQVGQKYGAWAGLLVAAALFGLRHLPADLFYAHLWHATPQMWLSREVELYLFAICLGLARLYGQSTWASAIAHGLVLVSALFSLG